MSFKAVKIEKNLMRTLLVSERADIDENKLPTNTTVGTNGLHKVIDNERVAIGSKAVCVEDWTKWVLSPDNKWVEVPASYGSGGNGGNNGNGGSTNGDVNGDGIIDENDFDIITDEEVDNIIDSL